MNLTGVLLAAKDNRQAPRRQATIHPGVAASVPPVLFPKSLGGLQLKH